MGKKIDELSIVIPCYNEQRLLIESMRTIEEYCKANVKKYEIIVVDDCSTDYTAIILKNNFKDFIVLRNEINMGKGYSVKKGMLRAKYKWVLFTDADLSTPITEIEKLLQYQSYDIIIGTRNAPGSDRKVNQPFYRVLAGKIFPIVVNMLMGWNYTDTQCGFKLFNKRCIKTIFNKQTIHRFAFDVELLYIGKLHKFITKEVPIVWENSSESKVKLIRDSLQMFGEIMAIKKNHGKLK